MHDENYPELDTAGMLNVADKLAEAGVLNLTLSGGEPFLRRDILDILTRAIENDFFAVSLLTNGTVLSGKHLDFLTKHARYVHAIQMSVFSQHDTVNDSYYDTTDASIDINCVFPIDRLRELDDEGVVGSVAARLWSGFMGRIYSRTKVLEQSGPALADALHDDDVDLFLLVPA